MFKSFPRLWGLYAELNCLLRLYVQLGPRERWLRKLTGLLAATDASWSVAFARGQCFSGVYAWVSVLTGSMYVGSTIDFRKRVYNPCALPAAGAQTACA